MDLDTVKTRCLCVHRPDPELVDDAGDLIGPEGTGNRDLLLYTGGGVNLIANRKC